MDILEWQSSSQGLINFTSYIAQGDRLSHPIHQTYRNYSVFCQGEEETGVWDREMMMVTEAYDL